MERSEQEPELGLDSLPPLVHQPVTSGRPRAETFSEECQSGHNTHGQSPRMSRSHGGSRSRSHSRSRSRERKLVSSPSVPPDSSARSAEDQSDFFPEPAFAGLRPSYVFKLGSLGLGYYRDLGTENASILAGMEAMRAAVAAQKADGVCPSSMNGVDTPIIAALSSHESALNDALKHAVSLETEVEKWGRASTALRHAAEVLEVNLTDQLKQLTHMLDDCQTVEGRAAVKAVMHRLRACGDRLLRISQPRTQ